MWLTSRATVAFICVIACSIGVQTVQFKNWEYRPLNCDAVAAAVATADCDGEGCRSTEASAWSADRQIRRLGNSINANFYSRFACSVFAPLALLFVWRHDGTVCLGEEGVWCFSACISKGEVRGRYPCRRSDRSGRIVWRSGPYVPRGKGLPPWYINSWYMVNNVPEF